MKASAWSQSAIVALAFGAVAVTAFLYASYSGLPVIGYVSLFIIGSSGSIVARRLFNRKASSKEKLADLEDRVRNWPL